MKNSIHKKILLFTIAMVFFTVAMCGFSITIYLRPFLNDIFSKDTQSAVLTCAHQINYYLDEVITYTKDISFQPLIQEMLNTDSSEISYEYFKLIFDVEEYLDQYIILHDNIIQDIFLVYPDGKTIETTPKYENVLSSSVYENLLKEETKNGFTVPHNISTNRDMEQVKVIAYVSSINSTTTLNKYLGKIVVLIKYNEFVQPLESFQENHQIKLYNESGQLLYPENLSGQKKAVDDTFYAYETSLSDKSWKIVGLTSSEHIKEGVSGIFRIMFFIMLVCTGLSIFISYLVTKNLTRPLNTLVGAMKRVSQGHRNVRVSVRCSDEIQEAAQVFNRMLHDINCYTSQLLDRDKKEYEMTMQMLIYQINPHFIYNTLNCVICLARKKSCDSIISLTRLFIVLLQSTLRTKPNTMTTIEEEMHYTDTYVSVLRYSYENIDPILWKVDPTLYQSSIPRLILYPIVENSIFHGILTEEKKAHVYVTIEKSDKTLIIEIRDDGHGIDPKSLADLNQGLKNGRGQEGHIGLVNVSNRLRLLYKERANLEIKSEKGKGTCVIIKISHD
ncbi:MAG TPA: histidine kinase [Candidatus Hungatella pullicola]|nr:histidine kinase [Candidatus Hungatella pullicola]